NKNYLFHTSFYFYCDKDTEFLLIFCKNEQLSYSTNRNWIQIVLCELLAAEIEGIEGIGAIGTVFEKVFF
ncbi:hypothetical protein, partial [Phocaeicola plebeius]|uniref:hypothetical protein n=1 Tax=Phocaeicola plebeius TaxID=310297 RepID=UPI0026ECD99B